MMCLACHFVYAPDEWVISARARGTACINCYYNRGCPDQCATEGHALNQTIQSLLVCPETGNSYRYCGGCNSAVLVSDEYAGIWVQSGEWLCPDHDDEVTCCDYCGDCVWTDDLMYITGGDWGCSVCYLTSQTQDDDDDYCDEDGGESVVPSFPHFPLCDICLTRKLNIHLLTEVRLCKCEAHAAMQRREPVLLALALT